jgi:hypothetical protein
MGLEFKAKRRESAEQKIIKLKSLHERIAKDPETQKFKISDLHISDLERGSYGNEYVVQKKTGEYQFCVQTVFEDVEGQTLPLKMWEPFAKVIGMTAEAFVKLEEEQQKVEFKNINSEACYNIVVKFTNHEFKLTNLELARGDNDEGDAMFSPAKKAKKAAAAKT